MPVIPRTHQYYPSVPLSELSDLYSKGDNRLNNQRACIISFLPKTLRISKDLPFHNKYLLWIENTANVTDIVWSYSLFLNGELINNNTFLFPSAINEPQFRIFFPNDVIDDILDLPLFDKLKVTCTVTLGADILVLNLEHNFINVLNAKNLPAVDEARKMCLPFSGNQDTTNYVLNSIKDYLPNGEILWNKNVVHNGVAEEDTLLKIVTAIIYHNVLIAANDNPGFNFFSNSNFSYDIDEYTNAGIQSFLNEAVAYDGDYKNGFCLLPIHILSDILSDITQVPDFTAMDSGAGNPIYNILRDNGLMTHNDLAGDILRTVPQQIQDSKLRITNDVPRFVELFNLTLLPKSAIALTAIVIKYLFECSKKNNCNECKNKSALWPVLTFGLLKDHPDFLKNILTHYFVEPSNKIESFAREAKKTTRLVWKPALYVILKASPRIVKAYFAKKIVKQIGTDYVFDFERIDSSAVRVDVNGVRLANQPTYDNFLGRQVYLVAETLYARGQDLTINVQPVANLLTGNTNSLELSVGVANNFITDIIKRVGNYDDLRNNNNTDFNDAEKEYFNIDHRDKVVVKLKLRPSTRATFDTWSNNLGGNLVNLKILAKLSANVVAFFGIDVLAARVQDEFVSQNDKYYLSNFRVENRIVFEIYHRDNAWNFQSLLVGNRRKIGKIQNDGANDTLGYFYFDHIDNEHELCSSVGNAPPICRITQFLVPEKGPRQNAIPALAARGAYLGPPNPIDMVPFRNAGENIDATELHLYANGTLVHGNQGDRWYPNTNVQDILLMNADILLDPGMGPQNFRAMDYNNFGKHGYNLRITFLFQDTRRRYANPDLFAGILGALAQLYLTENPNPNPQNINYQAVEIISEGFAYQDGSCYPSTTHRNGLAFDTHYNDPPRPIQQTFINAMTEYYFQQNIVGSNGSGHTGYANSVADNGGFGGIHDNHMHSHNFNMAAVDNLI